ncbi:sodium/hydrogen exchanger [Iris pallida]|uniref:Sodium/hydrogen exchanger n=1 Tax=Iris pallida TaxID=29817 RepID=A0AAX6DYB5_IRIPA|nr:sodium/hydrogen exchanger [Iris pallida]
MLYKSIQNSTEDNDQIESSVYEKRYTFSHFAISRAIPLTMIKCS